MPGARLSGLDATFVYGESQRIPLHVGSLTIVESAPLRNADGVLDIERLREAVTRRLHLVPRLRQRLVEVPFDQGRPVWVDDVRFRIENHVHAIGLPRPGTRQQLLDLTARLQSTQMDRTRPLWEIWYVDGLEDERHVAVVTKIHHCMVDGAAGVEVGALLYDFDRRGTRIQAPSWHPEAEPTAGELLVGAMQDTALDAVQAVRNMWAALRDPRRSAEKLRSLLIAIDAATEEVDSLPFNAQVSSQRRFDTVAVPFDRILATRKAVGVTVNDVVLAVVTGALRAYCENRRIKLGSLERIRALVPVNRRKPGDSELGSKVSSLFVELPVAERSAGKRLARLAEQTRALKDSRVADGTDVWNRLTGLLPVPLLRLASRVQFGDLLRSCNLLLSNVRGPQAPLYTCGAEVVELYPYFGIQDYLGLTIVVFSYNGKLQFGITTDPELMPDVDVFVSAIPPAVDELHCLAAHRAQRSMRTASARPRPHIEQEPARRRTAAGR